MKSDFGRGWTDAIAQWDNGLTFEQIKKGCNPYAAYEMGKLAAAHHMMGHVTTVGIVCRINGASLENLPQPSK